MVKVGNSVANRIIILVKVKSETQSKALQIGKQIKFSLEFELK